MNPIKSAKKRSGSGRLRSRSDTITTWAFLTPTFLILCITAFIPLLYSFYLSFHSLKINMPNAQPVFIGLNNFKMMFGDERFATACKNTVFFVVVSVAFEVVLGTMLAMMLSSDTKATRLIVSLCLIPMIMAPVASGTLWRMMLDRSTGVINYFITLLGVEPIAFLADIKYAMGSIIFVDVWRQTPWVTILMASALKGISSSSIEAAVVDGATRLGVFFRVILPLLRPVMIIVLMIRIVDGFKVFDTVFVMTGGGPGMATEMLPNFIYNQGLKYFNTGYSSAMAFVFIFFMSLVSGGFIMLRNKVDRDMG